MLIILVILGHIIASSPFEELNRNNSIWLALIYSFHIPLFIGISGFLLNINKVVKFNFFELLQKYWLRIILPWIIAALVYYLFSDNFTLSVLYPFRAIFQPYYHLWFIPAFLFWVLLTWALKRLNINNKTLVFVGLLITILSVVVKKYEFLYNDIQSIDAVMFYLLNVLKPYYYFFFVAGIYFKDTNQKIYKRSNLLLLLLVLLFSGVVYFFYHQNMILSTLNLFLLNTILIFWSVRMSKNTLQIKNNPLQWIGKNSLGFYLWHVIPIIVAKEFTYKEDVLVYLVIVTVLEIVFYFAYKVLIKIEFFKKYIFGM